MRVGFGYLVLSQSPTFQLLVEGRKKRKGGRKGKGEGGRERRCFSCPYIDSLEQPLKIPVLVTISGWVGKIPKQQFLKQ
jgi:hypothetical protein